MKLAAQLNLIVDKNMDTVIKQAISLRRKGKFDECRSLLKSLLKEEAYSSKAHLQIAWSYDNEGKEQEAIKHYKSALLGILSNKERFDSLFGLASTYRCLGDYTEALDYFEQIINEYPDSIEVYPFYAMCLYNLGRCKESTALLLKLLVSTTNNESIKEYQRAILLYADDLDKKKVTPNL